MLRIAASTGASLRGTIQNEHPKEFHAQNEFVFPPEPACPPGADVIEFLRQHVPQWNTLDQRLPHPRGRLDRRAGAGLQLADGLPLR